MPAVPKSFALASIGALTVLAACSSVGAHPTAGSSRSTPGANTLSVSVRGSAFAGLARGVRPGTVTVRFDNTGTRTHMAAIGELNGHRVADVTAYLQQHHRMPQWLRLVGGIDELAPSHRGSWTGTLTAGSYALISLSGDETGRPDALTGMISPFSVSGPAAGIAPPSTSTTVSLGAHGTLRMTRLRSGTTAIEVVNHDGMPRTVDVTRIRAGKSFADVMAEARKGTGVPAALLQLGGTGVPAHGHAVIGIEAAPAGAEYVVFDVDHVQQGAIAHETVR